jgi:hypothetical protein
MPYFPGEEFQIVVLALKKSVAMEQLETAIEAFLSSLPHSDGRTDKADRSRFSYGSVVHIGTWKRQGGTVLQLSAESTTPHGRKLLDAINSSGLASACLHRARWRAGRPYSPPGLGFVDVALHAFFPTAASHLQVSVDVIPAPNRLTGLMPTGALNPTTSLEHTDRKDFICVIFYLGHWPSEQGHLCFRELLIALPVGPGYLVIFPSWVRLSCFASCPVLTDSVNVAHACGASRQAFSHFSTLVDPQFRRRAIVMFAHWCDVNPLAASQGSVDRDDDVDSED